MTLQFRAFPLKINGMTLIRLPEEVSQALPSRGMCMIQGTINGLPFTAPLEPDGKGSHWFEVQEDWTSHPEAPSEASADVCAQLLEPWPAPPLPPDLSEALSRAGLTNQWQALTTKAQWEWVRWIRATANAQTREKRIGVACSKLEQGDKRPCCFDASRCSVPNVSKSGVLLD